MRKPTTGTLSPKAVEFNVDDASKKLYTDWRDSYIEYNPDKATAVIKEAGYNGDELTFMTSPVYYSNGRQAAEAIGSTAIVVTLDTHLLGWRTRDLDLAHLPAAGEQRAGAPPGSRSARP